MLLNLDAIINENYSHLQIELNRLCFSSGVLPKFLGFCGVLELAKGHFYIFIRVILTFIFTRIK
jgi:hypothetical protein